MPTQAAAEPTRVMTPMPPVQPHEMRNGHVAQVVRQHHQKRDRPPETATPAAARSGLPTDIGFSGRVTRVVDGDTFWIRSRNVSIRVWGLDAPERNQPGGAAATTQMTRLVSRQTLYCRQRDIDRFGRIVGQCFLPDGASSLRR